MIRDAVGYRVKQYETRMLNQVQSLSEGWFCDSFEQRWNYLNIESYSYRNKLGREWLFCQIENNIVKV